MASYNITLIPGDGIGKEVSSSARRCTDAIAEKYGFEILWEEQIAGEDALKKYGEVLPISTLKSITKNKVALKGPLTTPIAKGFRSVNVALRQQLGLFANVRPSKTIDGIFSRYDNVDIVTIRENTEDLYAGIEFDEGKKDTKELIKLIKRANFSINNDSAISMKVISKSASRKIIKFAFEYAKNNRRKKITAAHKANILKYTDGLFLKEAINISKLKEYKNIEFESSIIDNLSMHLVTKPEDYDILLCPNLYGDILSDMCAGLVGGLGVAPSANVGDKCAMFEPVHGSAPKHAGKNVVNPSATILSASMMLSHIGEKKAAKALELAVLQVIKDAKHVTYDLKPKHPSSTDQMTDEIIKKIQIM